MAHRDSHPEPIEGCFGCKVQNVGVQTLQIKYGNNPVEKTSVIADSGARAGRKVGQKAEHWNGRQDSTVYAPKLTIETKAREI